MRDNLFNIRMTFATLSLSGNCSVFNTWLFFLFANNVKVLSISGSIIFSNLLDIPSKP